MDVPQQKQDKPPVSPAPSASAPVGGRGGEVVTTLGPDTEFEGTLKFRHTLKIEGKFKGSITTDGHVIVGRTGDVKAEMRAGSLVIEGKMNGNTTADSLIDLRSSAEVHGNITASKLKIEEGVVFVGETSVMPKERRSAARQP